MELVEYLKCNSEVALVLLAKSEQQPDGSLPRLPTQLLLPWTIPVVAGVEDEVSDSCH